MYKTFCFISLTSFLIMLLYSVGYGQEQALWEQYKRRFISEDGRVIDFGQAQVSHSEGQGYGMFLAVGFKDRNTFEKLWKWTKNNLRVRADNLSAWQWGKRSNKTWGVIDYNNATDGDILMASALLKAAKTWGENSYREEGVKIVQCIRKELSVMLQGHILILPGYYGFSKQDGYVLNPSYFILPAYRSFAQVDDRIFWEKAHDDALFVISQAKFSSLALPADWIMLDSQKKVSVCSEKSNYFGYEAVRLFLYLLDEEDQYFSEGVKKILSLYTNLGFIPARVDLLQECIFLQPAPAGFYAIYALNAKKHGDEKLSSELFSKAKEILVLEEENYYSYTLYLLSIIWKSYEDI